MKGSDLVYELPLTLKEVANGTTKTISLQHQGYSEKVTVKIPKGLISGKKLRLAGKGSPSPLGGPPGDLFIQAKVLNDPKYRAEKYDLYLNQELKLSEVLLGTSISVSTLDDKKLSLKIPPGTSPGTKMRMPGHGLPNMKGNKKGDLYVKIQVKLPGQLTDEQKKLIEKLAAAGL
jgi:curved DNA-binding protein